LFDFAFEIVEEFINFGMIAEKSCGGNLFGFWRKGADMRENGFHFINGGFFGESPTDSDTGTGIGFRHSIADDHIFSDIGINENGRVVLSIAMGKEPINLVEHYV